MSWQGYVDNMMSTKNMNHVGIFGHDGSPWSSSPNFPLSAENIRTVISALSDSSKVSNGLIVSGEKYILVRSDPGIMLILKKGQQGLVAYKSAQCAIIALHDQSVKAETTLTAVGKVIDYLGKHGY